MTKLHSGKAISPWWPLFVISGEIGLRRGICGEQDLLSVIGDGNNLNSDARHERGPLESIFRVSPKTWWCGDIARFIERRFVDFIRPSIDRFLCADHLTSVVVPQFNAKASRALIAMGVVRLRP